MSGAPFNERAISRRHDFFAFLTSLVDDFIPGNGKMPVNDQEKSLRNRCNTLSGNDGKIRESRMAAGRRFSAGVQSAGFGRPDSDERIRMNSEFPRCVSATVEPLYAVRRKSNGACRWLY
ncbi:hypothetical protein [Burkholderia sp. MSMB1498]|uniref:hypothetical protein n=1 Tax=Burkholderia sp. MSMB1498 TaxID=1637842 RepID=UPI0012E35A02|nr:hypothetical protein [Burkholderia sp. MSMB1498]